MSVGEPAGQPSRWVGTMLVALAAIAFSGKAIIVKLAYRHGVDAVTLLALRMLFSAPLFLVLAWWAGRGDNVPISGADRRAVFFLGMMAGVLTMTAKPVKSQAKHRQNP